MANADTHRVVWVASERYRADPAPAGLAFVQDLLNTRPVVGRTDDLLATVRTAQAWADAAIAAWSRETGSTVRKTRLRSADLPRLAEQRDRVLALVRGEHGGHGGFDGAGLTARLDADGRVMLEPSGDPVAGIVAVEVFRAQQTGVWDRLKTCGNEVCPVAFYDRSPNRAGVWHNVRTCGNVANLRASRARRRAQRA